MITEITEFKYSEEMEILQPNLVARGVRMGISNPPGGITVSVISREIIVADTDNHRIQIFSQEGKFIMKFGSYGERAGQFNSPCYIAINNDNENIIVSGLQESPDSNIRPSR